jgi:uncharacterized phage protein gp47/JayE
MAFGVTQAGYNQKRLIDIQNETREAFLEKFGDAFDLDGRTPEGLIKGILDERISLDWELGASVYAAFYPTSSFGNSLDNVVALNGLTRLIATFSTVSDGIARGILGTAIPAGTIISVDGSSTSRFVTNNPSVISIASIDEVQTLTYSSVPDSGDFFLDFDGQITASIAFGAVAATIQASLEALSNIGAGNVLVTGDVSSGLTTITFAGTLAGLPQNQITINTNNLLDGVTVVTITPATTVEGDKAKSPDIAMTADATGPIVANTNSLTVIETPIVGLEEWTNNSDALLGTNIETDAELKLRRNQVVEKAGAATINAIIAALRATPSVTAVVVFQNILSIPDIDGRPPHSLDIVVEGGSTTDIGITLLNSVAAGIETIGDITEMPIDDQGFAQTYKFSRPTPVDIYLELDLTVDGSLYPVDGDDQVEALVLAYGNALGIGTDVVVFGSAPNLSCSFDSVPGITDIVIRVGKTVSPTLNDNVVMSPREISDWDSARIVITTI